MKLQLPCFICHKKEASEEELKSATMLSDSVALVKKEFNEYVFLLTVCFTQNHGKCSFPVSPFHCAAFCTNSHRDREEGTPFSFRCVVLSIHVCFLSR